MTVDDYKFFMENLGMELRKPNSDDPYEVQEMRWALVIGNRSFARKCVKNLDPWIKSQLREELGAEHAIRELRKIYDSSTISRKREMVNSLCSNAPSQWFDPLLLQIEKDGRTFKSIPYHWRSIAIEKLGGRMHLEWCPLWLKLRNALLDWEFQRKEDGRRRRAQVL
ncbi:hypothetical protein [Xanthomonas arboricola]|uniref:hypothetical protein n=1 Tax=Xanthomonas arboricola TaxID=56448 RepID=UPI0011B0DE60|nr:hypothetical protein [Xanthomonas arboricola]